MSCQTRDDFFETLGVLALLNKNDTDTKITISCMNRRDYKKQEILYEYMLYYLSDHIEERQEVFEYLREEEWEIAYVLLCIFLSHLQVVIDDSIYQKFKMYGNLLCVDSLAWEGLFVDNLPKNLSKNTDLISYCLMFITQPDSKWYKTISSLDKERHIALCSIEEYEIVIIFDNLKILNIHLR